MLWPASLESCNVLWSQLSNMHLPLYYFPAVLITQCNQGNLRNRVNFGIWFQAENHHDSKRQVWQQDQGTERLHLQLQPCEHEAESVNWRCSEGPKFSKPYRGDVFSPNKVAPSPKRALPTGTSVQILEALEGTSHSNHHNSWCFCVFVSMKKWPISNV